MADSCPTQGASMTKVKRITRPEFNNALKALNGKQLQAKVGFFPSAEYEDGTPIAYIAAIQEFGFPAGGIPPRSFIRSTIAEKKGKEWKQLMKNEGKKIILGKSTVAEALEAMALQAEGDMAKTITKITDPPLSPATLQLRKWKKQGLKVTGTLVARAKILAAKGLADTSGVSTKPLNDTGALLAHLTSTVEEKQ